MLLVCRYDVPAPDTDAFLTRARHALELLTATPGCLGGELGRAIEEPGRWVLQVRFTSVDAYRRALSPFPVREHVVPLLAEALADEPATFETLASGAGGAVTAHESLLAVSPDSASRPAAGGSASVSQPAAEDSALGSRRAVGGSASVSQPAAGGSTPASRSAAGGSEPV
ncbi:hypothetical protein PSU4_35900 [Pseudonocardia sulfidoxydans NBRC 16205]|uniref:ABM domain-containing protein n=1 Tax=Pseudonocardia sulfidoxydans NBRC 16205 TaxID=1223511 RepID=A0A511DIK6_9PSEU|nr:antibiotic biosynthesis monooxygenase family protein [Pseudonocardia sulfidoxydans]GEL24636.1 hypothetical protein PSU4_35900 [Pseudonocardia sulfidoxydans NBRC 16205]